MGFRDFVRNFGRGVKKAATTVGRGVVKAGKFVGEHGIPIIKGVANYMDNHVGGLPGIIGRTVSTAIDAGQHIYNHIPEGSLKEKAKKIFGSPKDIKDKIVTALEKDDEKYHGPDPMKNKVGFVEGFAKVQQKAVDRLNRGRGKGAVAWSDEKNDRALKEFHEEMAREDRLAENQRLISAQPRGGAPPTRIRGDQINPYS